MLSTVYIVLGLFYAAHFLLLPDGAARQADTFSGRERAPRASHANGAGHGAPARERVGESEGRSPSEDPDVTRALDAARARAVAGDVLAQFSLGAMLYYGGDDTAQAIAWI